MSSLAAPYPVEIRVEEEADIHQLYYDGEIDEDIRDRLVTMFLSKVDANLATRDQLYDVPGMTYEAADAILRLRAAGHISGPGDIRALPEITPEVWAQAEAFVVAYPEEQVKRFYGDVTAGGIGRTGHDDPSFYARAQSRFFTYGSAGVLLAVRPMLGTVHDAPAGGSLSARSEHLQFDFGAIHATWDAPDWGMVAGDYRIGYGLGVTLDTTNRTRPDGAYANLEITQDLDAGSLKTLDGFRGVALRFKRLRAGPGWFDVSAFGSYRVRDFYYPDLYYDRCPLGNPGCSSPAPSCVDSTTGDSLYCDYPTYPGIMREALGGGNLTYYLDERTAFGVTGYGAQWKMRVDAKDIQPAPSSRYPGDRSAWGVVGANARWGSGIVDLASEVAVTDRGKPGVLIKGWINPIPGLEIIPSFRYYDPGFDNPYSRGESDADEYLGLRSRDELGGRVVINWRPLDFLRLRADLDVWHHRYSGRLCDPAVTDFESPLFCGDATSGNGDDNPATDLEALLRVQILPTSRERITLWAVYHDRDLGRDGRSLSYDHYANSSGDFSGGSRIHYAATVASSRIPHVDLSMMFKHIFEDTYAVKTDFERSWYAWFRASANLWPGPRVALRVKFYDESTNASTERSPNVLCDDEDYNGTYSGGCPGSAAARPTGKPLCKSRSR